MKDDRYYWIKLYTNFFAENSAIDYLLTQANGCEYVMIYLKLCLSTANTNGFLCNQIGELIVPYNAEKICRDMKFCTIDTVLVALELFKKLGLIYEDNNGILVITDHQTIVGSETEAAKYKREQRKSEKLLSSCEQLLLDNVQENVQTISSRDKSIEYRYKNIDIYKERENNIVSLSMTQLSEIRKHWNDTCISLPVIVSMGKRRIQKLEKTLSEYAFDDLYYAFEKLEKSDFCCGRTDKSDWRASIDWLLQKDNLEKVLAGNYDNSDQRIKDKWSDIKN